MFTRLFFLFTLPLLVSCAAQPLTADEVVSSAGAKRQCVKPEELGRCPGAFQTLVYRRGLNGCVDLITVTCTNLSW